MMSSSELGSKVQELRELRRMADELAAEMKSITDQIKTEVLAREVDELAGSNWKITWKAVTTSRFDSKAFKATHAELYGQYTHETTSRRFTVA